jgi:hypothetical protein
MLKIALAVLLATAPQESVTVAQVHASYHQAFVVVVQPTPNDTLVGALVRMNVPATNPLASLVSRAPSLLTYLLQHGTDFQLAEILIGAKNQVRLQQTLDSALQHDERFNRLLLPLVAASLATNGSVLADQSRPSVRDSIAMDSAAFIAARFFFPDNFGPDGRLQSRICTGRNGLPAGPTDSDLILEAFVFDALTTALRTGNLPAVQEYRDTVQVALAALPATLTSAERLNGVRNAAWVRLAGSTSVRSTIADRFTALAAILPFQLR